MADENKSPILNNPYEEPKFYYDTDSNGNLDYENKLPGRRPYMTDVNIVPKAKTGQKSIFKGSDLGEPQDPDALFINGIREIIAKWRESGYPGTTRITKELLDFWFRNPERIFSQRLFFCQQEAVETAIWLNEVAERDPNKGTFYLNQLRERQNTVSDNPEDVLPRIAFKMATGAGKTVVMAMLILYNYINKLEYRGDTRFVDNFLIVAPGITIRDRLGVLKLDESVGNRYDKADYYHQRDLIPRSFEHLLGGLNAAITIVNYQQFEPKAYSGKKSSPMDGKLVYKDGEMVKQKGKEDMSIVLSRILGRQMKGKRMMVINDEAHHCYLPLVKKLKFKGDEKDEAEENNHTAMVWYEGLRQLKLNGYKVNQVYDLSATPYYLKGSGRQEYSIFPWVVSDFGLVEAIESGLVKIPFLPVADTTQELTEPKLRNIYEHIRDELPKKGQRAMNREARENGFSTAERPPQLPTLLNVAFDQFVKDYLDYDRGMREVGEAQVNLFSTPPVFIVVCNNTTVSKEVYKYLAGYKTHDADGNERNVQGHFSIFSNYDESGLPKQKPPTLLIDSQAVDEAADTIDDDFKAVFSDEIDRFKREYAQYHGAASAENLSDGDILREVVNTVGKPDKLGAHVRCVVSVSMLTEGWDANTVTHVCGIRAFGSQLLCEQVAGRALRRRSYDLQAYDVRTGEQIEESSLRRYKEENIIYKFPPEYAHIIGIPFKTFKAGSSSKPPQTKPKTEIKALPERREQFEITFPNVLGYRSEAIDEEIKADYTDLPKFKLDFTKIPKKTLMANPVEEAMEVMATTDPQEMRDAQVFYYLTKMLIDYKYTDPEKGRLFGKFAQLKRIVQQWYENQIELLGQEEEADKRLVVFWDVKQVVNSIYEGIHEANRHDEHITAILNYYNPEGSTRYVHGWTSKPVFATTKSHVNYVVADTQSWEQIAAKALEDIPNVQAYVKNSFLDFKVPYIAEGKEHSYIPDFIARTQCASGEIVNIVIEISGFSNDRTGYKEEKIYFMQHYWLPAVNNLLKYGRWDFLEVTDITQIKAQINEKIQAL